MDGGESVLRLFQGCGRAGERVGRVDGTNLLLGVFVLLVCTNTIQV